MARPSDDAILVRLVRRGDREALARLADKYWNVAWQAAYRVLLDRTATDDVTQEAIHRVIRSLDTFDETRPLRPWITRIAVNCALDELRRDRRLVRVAEPPDEAAPRWNEEASDAQVAVAEAVAALPAEKRIVVVLHYWLDYAVKDIADVLGVPVGTVLARLSRARAELREAIKEEENAA
ncbi:MAG TPA: sigma-70 family RNA polymerase sigma factor [Gaiellaceae bacterium]|jgi:RNA polymerase sigma factor (sigma-70 family)|nr:sigma-70 family RNA polymerase sigma factor [Gaiellaceae bacterium]